MRNSSIPPDATFTAQVRTLGIVAAWTTFVVNEAYAVVSGLVYASQGVAVIAQEIHEQKRASQSNLFFGS
jgi:hypothetical protein